MWVGGLLPRGRFAVLFASYRAVAAPDFRLHVNGGKNMTFDHISAGTRFGLPLR